MVGFFESFAAQVKKRDFFGTPVTLTYKGQSAFNTVCGGCISMLMVLFFCVLFAIQFHGFYMNPQYRNLPPGYNYGIDSVTVNPMLGSTVAVNIYSTSATLPEAGQIIRAQFS